MGDRRNVAGVSSKAIDTAVIIFGAACVIPMVYTVWFLPPDWQLILRSQYTENLMISWAATVLGVGAGLPFALWLNRLAQHEASRADMKKAADLAADLERHTLSIVHNELNENKETLDAFEPKTPHWVGLQSARWEALKAAGSVSHIRNLGTLDAMAKAYESVCLLQRLLEQWLHGAASHAPESGHLWTLVAASAADANETVTAALACITKVDAGAVGSIQASKEVTK